MYESVDIERLKEIRDWKYYGPEYDEMMEDMNRMLPEIIDRLVICRNCKNYVPQDQWTEMHTLGVIDVYDPAYCSKKLPNFSDHYLGWMNQKNGAGKCEGFELE